MPIIRRALTVTAVTAASTAAFALPAWAHTASFTPHCHDVTIDLSAFRTDGRNGPTNTVHILRNDQELGPDKSPVPFGQSTSIVIPEAWDKDTVTYRVLWSPGELSDDFVTRDRHTYFEKTLTKPENCEEQPPGDDNPPPADDHTQPAGDHPSPAAPSTTPASVAPATPAPTTSAPAVEGSRLANTGAGNTVPLAIVGTVLVAGGVGLTLVTRRRRSARGSSATS